MEDKIWSSKDVCNETWPTLPNETADIPKTGNNLALSGVLLSHDGFLEGF